MSRRVDVAAWSKVPADEMEERRIALLRLTRGQVRGRAFAMLEAHNVWKGYYSDLALLWGWALMRAEYCRKAWDVWAIFGGVSEVVEHSAYPTIRFWRELPLSIAEADRAEERANDWADMEEAAVDGGVDSLLEAYWSGVPIEDLLADVDPEEWEFLRTN